MSRDVEVSDIQRAVDDIRAWANGSSYLSEPTADLLKAIADMLEALLVNRDDLVD